MPEIECFGVDYERYALIKLQGRLTRKYRLNTVLEIPASGEKAMPSIYSLGFGLAGCDVTLMNGDESRKRVWEKLGIEEKVTFAQCVDITQTGGEENSFDLVWNFAAFPKFQAPQAVLTEMIRVSRKFVAVFSVNGYNVGFPVHRTVHKLTKIPWTHGDIRFNSPYKTKRFFQEHGIKKVKIGVVDCPPWPDSLGFRDVRLHRSAQDLTTLDWHSKLVDYLHDGHIPLWIRAVYAWERIPLPTLIKFPYSHIFYVFGEKG